MEIKFSVFVESIIKTPSGNAVVTASNGSPEGPPFVRFELPNNEIENVTLGKRYRLTITDFPTP